jgi:hypothetical protein
MDITTAKMDLLNIITQLKIYIRPAGFFRSLSFLASFDGITESNLDCKGHKQCAYNKYNKIHAIG